MIKLEEDDPGAVERMISYLYTLEYDDGYLRRLWSSRPELGDGVNKEAGEDEASAAESQQTVSQTPQPSNEPSEGGLSRRVNTTKQACLVATGKAILANIHVYSIADKYDIVGLKQAARLKFSLISHYMLGTDVYPQIIRLVYETTPSSDRGLRDIVARNCGAEIRTLVDNPIFSALAKELPDFSFDVLCFTLNSDDLKRKSLLEDTMALVNKHESCKQCETRFHGRLESERVLRCNRCNTRHV